jgi:hypothetical protein
MPVITLFRLAKPAARRAALGQLIVLIAWDSLDLPFAGLAPGLYGIAAAGMPDGVLEQRVERARLTG